MQEFKGKVEEAARVVRGQLGAAPRIALILGTGLGDVAGALSEPRELPYQDIPHHPVSTVPGHRGRLLCGEWAGKPVLVLQGRFHLYEGYSATEISFPIRVLRALGIRTLIVSNAAGGLNPRYRPEDLMLKTDHINLTGHNPLVGPNLDEWGPRFPDMVEPYSRRLQALAFEAALELKTPLHRGVYVGVLGPSLETAAETRFLRAIGADAVGMSSVIEAITAVHAGMEVMGVSVITNVNLPDCYQPASIESVIAAAERAGPKLMRLLGEVIGRM